MADANDINSTLQLIARQMGLWVQLNRLASGSLTLTAAATTVVVVNTAVKPTSEISFSPTNATAALTQRTNGLFVSAITTGSFSLSTQSGAAIGTETFSYTIFNPT